MKNLYLKIFVSLSLLICFSANVIFAAAITVSKTKIYLSESKENATAEKKLDIEEKLVVLNHINLSTHHENPFIIKDLALYSIKFSLPNAFQNLPERPPKG